MSRWQNPNDPFEVGLEWMPIREVREPVDFAREVGHRIVLPSTVTVTGAAFFSPGPIQTDNPDSVFWEDWIVATLYEEGFEREFGEVREARAAVSGGSTNGSFIGGAVSVQEALAQIDTQGIDLDPNEWIRIRFGVPAFVTATNTRILDVTFDFHVQPVVTGAPITLGYRVGGVDMPLAVVPHEPAEQGRVYSWSTGEIFQAGYNWVTDPAELRKRVWLRSDFSNLNSGAVEFLIRNDSDEGVATNINWAAVRATYCSENRAGSAAIERTSLAAGSLFSFEGWQDGFEWLTVPSGDEGVTLLQARPYLLTLTRATNSFQAEEAIATNEHVRRYQFGLARNIRGLSPVDRAPFDAFSYPRDTRGLIVAERERVGRNHSLVLTDGSGVVPEGSQPYASSVPVDTPTIQPSQEVLSTTGGSYSHARLVVRKFGQPGNLTVSVGASTAQLSSDVFDAVAKDADGWASVTIPFDVAAVFAAGVERTVEVDRGGGPSRWEFPIIETREAFPPGSYAAATYGGADQTGTNTFGIFDARVDYPVTLLMAAPAVTGVTVEQGIMPLAQVDEECPVPGRFSAVDYAQVCWGDVPIVTGSPEVTGAPLVTGFCAWEVERRDELDAEWRLFARITEQNNRCVQDFEGRIGVASDYRVRVCRLDGVCGGYGMVTGHVRQGALTGSPPVTGAGCDGLVLTSNEDPTATLAYPMMFDGSPVEDFTFLEASTVTVERLHMRDYQVAFRPLERGGVQFDRVLLVNAIAVPPARLDEGFRELRDLAWDTLSYVAVLDGRGRRWLAAVLVPEGSVRESGQYYMASVTVIEVTDRPSVIDVGVA